MTPTCSEPSFFSGAGAASCEAGPECSGSKLSPETSYAQHVNLFGRSDCKASAAAGAGAALCVAGLGGQEGPWSWAPPTGLSDSQLCLAGLAHVALQAPCMTL